MDGLRAQPVERNVAEPRADLLRDDRLAGPLPRERRAKLQAQIRTAEFTDPKLGLEELASQAYTARGRGKMLVESPRQ